MPKPTRMSKPDEDRAKHLVLCIYKGIAHGWDYARIAERLNELKIKPFRCDRFNYLNIQQIVTVIQTGKQSWYRWAFDLLVKERKLSSDGVPV